MLEFQQNLNINEVIVRLKDKELVNKTIARSIELIAQRIADDWYTRYGDKTVKEIGIEQVKSDLVASIDKRLMNLNKTKTNEDS